MNVYLNESRLKDVFRSGGVNVGLRDLPCGTER